MEHIQLEGGNYYHIFNRGNNACNLFEKAADYEHFLCLYDKYISPIANTLAWVLMPNHFHLIVLIKENVVYKYSLDELAAIAPDKLWFEEHKWETSDLLADDLSASPGPDNVGNVTASNVGDCIINADRSKYAVRLKDVDRLKLKTPVPYRHFGHLFNAYNRYLQIHSGRTGNLFERPFKRKLVDTDTYLKQVILYIHNNPVHHKFCDHPLEYPWSSYIGNMLEEPAKMKCGNIIHFFGDKENFEYQHNMKIDVVNIEKWLEIEDAQVDTSDLSASPGPDNVGLEMENNDGIDNVGKILKGKN